MLRSLQVKPLADSRADCLGDYAEAEVSFPHGSSKMTSAMVAPVRHPPQDVRVLRLYGGSWKDVSVSHCRRRWSPALMRRPVRQCARPEAATGP